MTTLGEIGDSELEDRCHPRAWERPLLILEITATLLGGLAAGTFAYNHAGPMGFLTSPFAAVFAALGIWWALRRIHSLFPIEAAREELAFRRWREGLLSRCPCEKFPAWPRRMMALEPTADWLIAFQGAGLPHGGTISTFIMIDRSGESRVVARQIRGFGNRGSLPPSEENPLTRRSLAPREHDELVRLLADNFPGGFRPPPREGVCDGFPCHLLILRRDPPAEVCEHFNLAAFIMEDKREPSIALATWMLGLAQGSGDGILYGMTDRRGNITIGQM
jgi:hypothetical protein